MVDFWSKAPKGTSTELTLMIIVSDNACTGTIVDLVGLDNINEFCQNIGMVNTKHIHGIPLETLKYEGDLQETNFTSSNDVTHLLNLILKASKQHSLTFLLSLE